MTIAEELKKRLDQISNDDIQERISWFSLLLALKKSIELENQFISRVSFEDCEIELSEVYRYSFDDGSSLRLEGTSPMNAVAFI